MTRLKIKIKQKVTSAQEWQKLYTRKIHLVVYKIYVIMLTHHKVLIAKLSTMSHVKK